MSLIWLCHDLLCYVGSRSDGGGAVQVCGSVRHPSERCHSGHPDRQSGNMGGIHRPHIHGKINNHRHKKNKQKLLLLFHWSLQFVRLRSREWNTLSQQDLSFGANLSNQILMKGRPMSVTILTCFVWIGVFILTSQKVVKMLFSLLFT